MILIVRGGEVSRHRPIMETLYRERFENFVIRRNWSLPSRDGLDIDQYDNEDAVYFMVLDDDRHILASARIHNTQRASLLADLFPSLIETNDEPRGATLFEGTRYMVSPRLSSQEEIKRARVELNCSAVEWMMAEGGTQIQAVVDWKAFPSFVAMSMTARPLGLPKEYGGGNRIHGGGRCVAFRWDLTLDLLEDFRAYGRGSPAEGSESLLSGTLH